MSDSATLYVSRKKNFVGSLRQFDVIVDGTKVGRIRNGEEKSFEVSPGSHSVQIQNMARSELVEVRCEENGVTKVECGVAKFYWLYVFGAFIGTYVILRATAELGFDQQSRDLVFVAIILILIPLSLFKRGLVYYLKKPGDW